MLAQGDLEGAISKSYLVREDEAPLLSLEEEIETETANTDENLPTLSLYPELPTGIKHGRGKLVGKLYHGINITLQRTRRDEGERGGGSTSVSVTSNGTYSKQLCASVASYYEKTSITFAIGEV